MKAVTYLFGAGASANCLPLVKNFHEEMVKLVEILKAPEYELSTTDYFIPYSDKPKNEVKLDFIVNMEWLIKECKNHASIDTYAKKLYIRSQSDDLLRLKATLSVFFVLLQSLKGYDKRYDTFFASILKMNALLLPENIRILSWNYDFQFEKAFAEYSDDDNFGNVNSYLNIKSKFTRLHQVENSGFCILKINGTPNLYKEHPETTIQYTRRINSAFNNETLEIALKNYTLQLFNNSG